MWLLLSLGNAAFHTHSIHHEVSGGESNTQRRLSTSSQCQMIPHKGFTCHPWMHALPCCLPSYISFTMLLWIACSQCNTRVNKRYYQRQNQEDALCYGLNKKCPPEARVFEHLILSWWHCLGSYETLSRQSLAEGSTSWGWALRFYTQVSFWSLPASWWLVQCVRPA